MTKVSIVIPVYNAEKYVAECVESALSQTYRDNEVIVVDDGSTDGSRKVLERFSDRITMVAKENGGTASALNEGIRRMSGEWFKWLSADDRLHPWAVKDIMEAASAADDAQDCIFYGGYDLIDSDGNVVGRRHEPDLGKLGLFHQRVTLLIAFYGNGTTSLIHRSAFERYGRFDEGLGIGEDYDMWLRLCILHGFRLHLVPKTLAQYRIHDEQLSATKNNQGHTVATKIKRRMFERMNPSEVDKYKAAVESYSAVPASVRILEPTWRVVERMLPARLSMWVRKTYAGRRGGRL